MIRTILLFTLLIGTLSLTAVHPDFRFAHLGVKDGLPNNSVLCLLEDSDHFIWAGTTQGLARYNGIEFMGLPESSQAFRILENAQVLDLAEDSLGNIWIATFGEGLACYIRSTGKVRFFRNDPKDSLSLPTNEVSRVAVDKENNLWVGTTQGLCRLKPGEEQFRIFRNDSLSGESIVNDYIYAVLPDREGRIWVGTPRGMSKLIPMKGDRYKVVNYSGKSFSSTSIWCLAEGLDGAIWIGFVWEGYGRFDPDSEQFAPYPAPNGEKKSYPYKLFPDKQGKLWIGYLGLGLACLDINSREIQNYAHISCEQSSLGSDWVFSICPAQNGRWWVAHSAGLSYFRPYDQYFKPQPFLPELKLEERPVINAIYSKKDNQIWAGTSDGVYHRNTAENEWRLAFNPASFPNNENNRQALCLYEDSKGRVWGGTETGGPILWEPGKKQGRIINSKVGRINDFYEDFQGRIWIATDGQGLCLWTEGRPDTLDYFFRPEKKGKTVKERINCLLGQPDGTLWVGTIGEGILVFDPEKTEFVRTYTHNRDSSNGLSNNFINDLKKSPNGGTWIGTRNGLNYFDRGSHFFTVYQKKNGLPDNSVKAVFIDREENIWAATNKGVAFLDTLSRVFIPFGMEDGATNNEFNRASISVLGEELYFLSGSEIFSCVPSRIPTNPIPPQVVLTGFRVLNVPYSMAAAPEKVKDLTIDYKDYTFTFEFATPSASSARAVEFMYKLEGLDEDWVHNGNRRSMTYTQLAPGDYTFMVKAKFPSGTQLGEPLNIRLHIKPAFWQTGWFRTLIGLAIGLILLSFLWLAKRQIDARHQQELAEQSAAYKSQFLANMSHEIRTPMHSVLSAVDLLSNSSMDPQQTRYVQGIRQAGNNLLGLINDILDFSRIEAGKLEFKYKPFQLREVVNYVEKTLGPLAKEQGSQLEFHLHENVPSTLIGDSTRLGQILLNLMGNGIKFCPGGLISLDIQNEAFAQGTYTLKFIVSDDGVGIPEEELERIFESFHQATSSRVLNQGGVGLGLAISRQLIEQQGGKISVESKVNEGTIFTFFLPFKVAEFVEEVPAPGAEAVALQIKKLLLVEDVDLNRELTEEILSQLFPNAEISSAASGKEALDRLDQGFVPDVVLMDIRMPEMDGLTCTKHIRKRYDPLLPVFALTASATQTEIQRCLIAGLDGVLPKPFTPAQLVVELESLLHPDIVPESLHPDHATLENFLGDDEGRIKRYLSAGKGEIQRHFQDFRTSLAEGNTELLQVSAHSLKTTFKYMGIVPLAELFTHAEEAADRNDLNAVSELAAKAAGYLKICLKQLLLEG